MFSLKGEKLLYLGMSYILVAVVAVLLTLGATFLVGRNAAPAPSVTVEESPATLDVNTESPEVVAEPPVPPINEPEPVVASGRATLDLSGQGLTQVAGSVFDRTGLEVLDVSGNKLTGALPAEVRKLSNLRSLDLSDNQFTGVPAEVGQLSKLEYLDLSNNPITGLPYELGNLKNLRTLDLRGTNYAVQDLAIITQGLPPTVQILTD